jgi:hypothetical protein
VGRVKGLLPQGIYSRRELNNSSKLTEQGQKAARQKNTSLLIRARYSLFLRVIVKKGIADDSDLGDE